MKKFFQGHFLTRLLPASFLSMFIVSPAYAYDWMVVGNVTIIEGTYMPSKIVFQFSQNAGTCTSGAWLTWNAQGSNAADRASNTAAIMAMMLTAKVTGKTLTIFGNNSGCTIDFMWFN